MAASLDGVFTLTLQEKIKKSKVLVVGAGGIGCEILKNLVLSGFPIIEIIDLDTIDLSNLNRQFLFRREHVGKSKAMVARESALQFNPNVKITAYHDSIMATDYGVNFFNKFDIVLNALDNRAARNHVNRMCLNAEVPLIESGTAGYNGQVEFIKKGLTQCYECTPKATQKTFPGCTIRNTPSEPIHCIVWAKHLFNQLFGETIDDEDISPDIADPEAQTLKDNDADNHKQNDVITQNNGNVVRVSTRQWAKDNYYDPETLFNKFFYDDIKYLLSMSNLWKTRKPPTPITWSNLFLGTFNVHQQQQKDKISDYHKIWSLSECATIFKACLKNLSVQMEKLNANDFLVWDKDDQAAMDFVAACANIRASIFQIPCKTRFEIKSMAGNIIPAIATTNAITAGLVVMLTFKVLQDQFDKCKSVYAGLRPNAHKRVLVPEKILIPPNPNCYVCSAEPAIHLKVDTKRMRVKEFRDDILIKTLNMVNPDVIIDTKGTLVISSEEGETASLEEKVMADLNIVDGVLLKCDDFFQNYQLSVIIIHKNSERDDPLFEVVDKNQLKPKIEEKVVQTKDVEMNSRTVDTVGDGPSTSKKSRSKIEIIAEDDDDDLYLIEDDNDTKGDGSNRSIQKCAIDVAVDVQTKLQLDSDVKLTDMVEKVQDSSTQNKRKVSINENKIDQNDVTEIYDSDEDERPLPNKRCRLNNTKVDSADDIISID